MRRHTTIIKCDGDGCKVYVEVPDTNDNPDGWYRVQEAKDGKMSTKASFDLCSLRCVEKWAKGRRVYLSGGPTGESRGHGEAIMALFHSDPTTELSTADISELLGISRGATQRCAYNLGEKGLLRRTHEGGAGPGNSSRYQLAVQVPA